MIEHKSLAVVILTKNEEQHIAACMASVSFADEIIVIDSGSTDRTQAIAEASGARFISHPMTDEGFAGQRNFALTQTTADWVLYIDADERVQSGGEDELRQIIQQAPAAYKIRRWNIIFGQKMKYGDHGPDWCLRFFPRSRVHWEGRVHERAITDMPVRRLHTALDHYTYNDWNRYFDKFNQYTTMMAERMMQQGKKASFGDILTHPFFAFLRFYIFRLGFLDGKQGFIFAINHYFYTMIKYVKLYYWQRR